jgi:hypothetical protein
MDAVLKAIGGIVLVAVIVFLVAALFAFPTKWLWNWLMPEIFNLRQINAWQAFGLMFLSGLFFKSSVTTKKD